MLTILTAALLSATSPAAPLPSRPAVTTVSHQGLDLSQPRDIATFDRRIRSAVEQVCGTASSADLAGQNRVAECRDDTLALVRLERDRLIAKANMASDGTPTLAMSAH